MNEQISFEFKERPTIKGFPELRWTGKRPYRSTQYFPAQLRERYGEKQDGWINKIFWGDNLQVMSHLLKEFRGKVDLIYIDPPFDSKADYKKKITMRGQTVSNDITSFEEKQYGDIWTNDEYLQFMYERLIILRELLSDTGCLALHCDWHKSSHLRMLLDEVFGQSSFVNEIVWKYASGGIPEYFFAQKHDTIFVYSKTSAYTFNKDKASFPRNICQECGTQMNKWNNLKKEFDEDGRVYRTIKSNGKIYKYYDDEPVLLSDVWTDISHIQQKDPQRLDYPTQKPEKLIGRIIESFSNPGDLVFDCFMGSGTTQAVAMKLGRRFIGADINLGAVQTTTKRLISLATELKSEEKPLIKLLASGKKGKVEYTSTVTENYSAYVAEESGEYLVGTTTETDEDDVMDEINTESTETTLYTGFEVYNVNNYEFFRNPIEARDLLIEALEIQSFSQSNVWDGELDGRMMKIMPVNRIATKADLEELKANLPYKVYEKRKEENPNQPVERITIVCMGHEPDLKASLEQELSGYKLDIEIVDILRDKAELQLKREAEADIAIENGRLVIRAFYPLNLMQKLSLQKEFVDDWRQLVESVMIDWNYDGVVMQPTITDVPSKKDMVKGIYDIPADAGTIKVKITDLLSESLEAEVK